MANKVGKKTGRKANYITFGGQEVKDILNGREIGVCFDRSAESHYVMIPQQTGRTKRKWLGKDAGKAVATFTAIVAELKEQQEKFTLATIKDKDIAKLHKLKRKTKPVNSVQDLRHNLKLRAENKDIELIDTGESITYIPETLHIDWLITELQDPKALARKTGIEEFAEFGKLLAKDTDIPLQDLLDNYLNKKKTITQKSKDDSETFFDTFVSVIDCKTVDEITLKDVHRYEDYMHESGLAPKTIKNRMDIVSTIFNYNTGRYNSSHLIQVHRWLKGLDRPEQTEKFNPELMSLEHFNTLYKTANLKWKAMLLLGLNCAMYPVDLIRLKRENINFEDGTIAFRRGKTGKVLAVSTLWARTKRALKKYLDSRKDNSPYIFLNLYKTNYQKSSGITNYFNESLRHNSGIPKAVKFNHLRDTFSTFAQDAGYSIEQINLVLGHINKGMQDRYAVRHANKLTGKMCRSVEREFFKPKK